MKKWQAMSHRFLVLVLLSANLVGLAPLAQAATEEAKQPQETEIKKAIEQETEIENSSFVFEADTSQGTSEEEASNEIVEDDLSEELVGSQAAIKGEGATSESEPLTRTEASESREKGEKTEKNTIPVQLLGLNDFHGAINTKGTAYLEGGEKHTLVGQASNLAAHLDEASQSFLADNPTGVSERLQGGDLVGASPANSALLQDEPTIKIFNKMNFGIGTIGNHEFDQGLAEFKRIMDGRKPISGQFKPIVENYPREKSTMEVVLANVVNKEAGPQGEKGAVPYGFKPYIVKEYGKDANKVKVGYIGIVTTEFPNLVLKQHHQDYDVLDEAETIVKYSKELRKEGVNAIVIISHLAATSSKQEVQGEVVDVMQKVDYLDADNSVDVVFAGHNHQYTNGVIKGAKNDVRVVQSTSQGKAYIDLRGELDVETKDFVAVPTAEVKPTTDRPDKNQEIVNIVAEADELVKTVTEDKVGSADAAATQAGMISRAVTPDSESALGNLVTEAQLYMAQNGNYKDDQGKPIKVDFALTNNGGIRADLAIKENGDITWGNAQLVQPFGNILQLVEISGKDLKGALNEQHPVGKEHYFLQIAGLKMTYSTDDTGFKVKKVTDNQDKEINDEEKYVIVINDFLLGGGDGFASFTKGKLLQAMDTDTNIFIQYFELKEKAGEKISAPATDRKSLATTNPETPLTEEELKAATTITKLTEGDKVIMGQTVANGSVKLKTSALTREVPVSEVADAEGNFQLALENPLVKGEVVTLIISAGATTVEVTARVTEKIVTEPKPIIPITEAELREKSIIAPVRVGDKTITGQSLAGTVVTYRNKGKIETILGTATTDKNGQFRIAVKEGLKADEILVLEFSKETVKLNLETTVLKAQTNTNKKPSNNGGGSKYLPQTGEEKTIFTFVGMSLLMVSYTMYLKREKDELSL